MIVRQVLVKLDGNVEWHRPEAGWEPDLLPMEVGQTKAVERGPVRTLCGLEGVPAEVSVSTWTADAGVLFPEHGEIRCPACAV